MFGFPGVVDDVLEGGGVESFLVLEVWGKVDAVIFADVADGLWRELLGFGRDAHGVENVTTSGEVTTKGTGADISQTSEFALADKAVLIIKIDHKNFIFIIDFCRDLAKQVNLMAFAAPKVVS